MTILYGLWALVTNFEQEIFMNNLFLITGLFVTLFSCGKNDEKIEFHKADQSKFTRLINNSSLPTLPNLSIDRKIVNNSYPIEIALYNNNKFYYDLPNLGDGTGEWIHAADIKAENFAIKFIDRFGINKIKVTAPITHQIF
jgi:hypothetical protein